MIELAQNRDPAACGLTFSHDWHGFLDDNGRTCVCDGELRRQGLK